MIAEIRKELKSLTASQEMVQSNYAACQYCGNDYEFLMISESATQSGKWLCSSCYSHALANKGMRL